MDVSTENYLKLVHFYESCFEQHGTTPKGVDWPNAHDLQKRFSVMLALCQYSKPSASISILDLGCGYGALLDFLVAKQLYPDISYRGIDLSEKMLAAAKLRHPNASFEHIDILKTPLPSQCVDYVILNGVLTEKRGLSYVEMELFAQTILQAAFKLCRIGIAFNVMSAHVDWQNDNLFYWEFDKAAAFLKTHCSRHIVFRADYGLYEYTTYVYRHPLS